MPDSKRLISALPVQVGKPEWPTHLTFLLNFADELNPGATDRK